jgi:hypothetical protein
MGMLPDPLVPNWGLDNFLWIEVLFGICLSAGVPAGHFKSFLNAVYFFDRSRSAFKKINRIRSNTHGRFMAKFGVRWMDWVGRMESGQFVVRIVGL